ncbi:ribonucleotide reductase subunit alpha [Halomonas garicola]|uniref:ribonucleotide reductase subunit alpha n=1 Tax=Halomonas garicola TaxID=1690008 RepID=UPI002899DDEE|nr:ribonucleotide reductase subunit alpha [Halomonas garicola]
MAISSFNDLLGEARSQHRPQRLLLVFARAELPDFPDDEQRRQFEQSEGGVLAPTVCVDKTPDELEDMNTLVKEAEKTGAEWDLFFVAAMDDPKDDDEIQKQLTKMTESLQTGNVGSYIAFDKNGEALSLN